MAPGQIRRLGNNLNLQKQSIEDQAVHPSLPEQPLESSSSSQPAVPPTEMHQSLALGTSAQRKRGRGATKGKDLTKINQAIGARLTVHISEKHNRPTDRIQSAKLSSELGVTVRKFISVPLPNKKLPDGELEVAYNRLGMRLDIVDVDKEHTQKFINSSLKRRTKDFRYKLKKEFLQYGSIEEAKEHVPQDLTKENWCNLCDYWMQEDTKLKAGTYVNNRKQNKMLHNQGSKAFAVSAEEMRQKNQLTEGEFNRKDFFKYTRYTEGKGWVTAEAEQAYNKMEQDINNTMAKGLPVDVEEVYDIVRGTTSGYVKGLGYGPKPTLSSSKIKQLQEALTKSEQALTKSDTALTQSQEAFAKSQEALKHTHEALVRTEEALQKSQAECVSLHEAYDDVQSRLARIEEYMMRRP